MSGNNLVYGLVVALREDCPLRLDMRFNALTGDEKQNFKAKIRNDPKPLGRQFIESAGRAIGKWIHCGKNTQDIAAEGLKAASAFIYRSARAANDRDGKSIWRDP